MLLLYWPGPELSYIKLGLDPESIVSTATTLGGHKCWCIEQWSWPVGPFAFVDPVNTS